MEILRRDYGDAYLAEIGQPGTNGRPVHRIVNGSRRVLAKCAFDSSLGGDFGYAVPGTSIGTVVTWGGTDSGGNDILVMDSRTFSAEWFDGAWDNYSWSRSGAYYGNGNCELPGVFDGPSYGDVHTAYSGGMDGTPFSTQHSLVYLCQPVLYFRIHFSSILAPWWGGPAASGGKTPQELVAERYKELTGLDGSAPAGCWAIRAQAHASVENEQYDPDTGQQTGYGYGYDFRGLANADGWFLSAPRHRIGGTLPLSWTGSVAPVYYGDTYLDPFANKAQARTALDGWADSVAAWLRARMGQMQIDIVLANIRRK